jgi:hypothetical protein
MSAEPDDLYIVPFAFARRNASEEWMRLRYVFSLVTGNLPLPLDSNLEPGQFRCRDPFAERYCSACKMFRATMILCIQDREDAPVIS